MHISSSSLQSPPAEHTRSGTLQATVLAAEHACEAVQGQGCAHNQRGAEQEVCGWRGESGVRETHCRYNPYTAHHMPPYTVDRLQRSYEIHIRLLTQPTDSTSTQTRLQFAMIATHTWDLDACTPMDAATDACPSRTHPPQHNSSPPTGRLSRLS